MIDTSKKLFYDFNSVTKDSCFAEYPVYISTFVSKITNHDLHSHDFIEIVLVHGGSGIHFTQSGNYSLVAGDIFIIPRGIKHGYKDLHNFKMTNIIFKMKIVEKHLPQMKLMAGFFVFFLADISSKDVHKKLHSIINPDKEHFDTLVQLCAQIQYEAKQALSGAKIMSLLKLGEIILRLSRLYEQNQNEASNTSDYSRLSQVYAYINTNFKNRLSICKLASIAGMSERNFQRVFTKINGISPTSYIMNVRLENALDKLHDSNLPIFETALDVGFTDCSYFSSQFKKKYDISPSQYQKTIKNRDSFKPQK